MDGPRRGQRARIVVHARHGPLCAARRIAGPSTRNRRSPESAYRTDACLGAVRGARMIVLRDKRSAGGRRGHRRDRGWLGKLRGELEALLAPVFLQATSRLTAFAYIGRCWPCEVTASRAGSWARSPGTGRRGGCRRCWPSAPGTGSRR